MAEAMSEEQVSLPQGQGDLPEGEQETKSDVKLFDFIEGGNLIEELKNATDTAQEILQRYDTAKQSMEPWLEKYEKALKLAKMEPDSKEKNFPFKNASNVMMPFILEAMLDFHSRTVPELVWSQNLVQMEIHGESSAEKEDKAGRVADFMDWQLAKGMDRGTWRKRQDKMLLGLPCTGTAYKHTTYDFDEQEASSRLLLADAVIFDQAYDTFDEAPDKFLEEEYTRNEVVSMIRGAAEWDLDEDKIPLERDHPEPWEVIRALTWIDLDDDGLDEPYEVIIWREDDSIISVRAAFDREEIQDNDDGEVIRVRMCEVFTQYQFLPDPEGGPMGMGWGILLCDLFRSLNTTVRQSIDAGTLANLAGNSGLIDQQLTGSQARGNRQQAGPVEVRMGSMTPVSTGGKPLRDSVYQFPYAGPNGTLFQLTEWMLTQVRDMTNSALNMDTNSQEAAMMYLARLQQGLKVPNSIVMRVYNGAAEEFSKIALINYKHFSDERYNKVLDGAQQYSMAADFDPTNCDMIPAVDPSQGSDIERQQRAQIILEEAKTQQAQVLNVREAYLDWLKAMKAPDIERLAPEPSGEPDPMEQVMMANLQREADLAERDMQLREAKQDLDRTSAMLKAMKEGGEMALKLDLTEAQITKAYADAMFKLWEMGMAGDNPVKTVQDIEGALIDQQVAAPPPTPQPAPMANPPAPQGGSQGAPI